MTHARNIGTFLLLLLFGLSLQAQTLIDQNWSTGNGLVAPAGWTTTISGVKPAPWRFDNPGNRPFAAPFAGKFAIVDSDNNTSGTAGVSVMTSPVFNATGFTQLNLTFDQQFRALQTTGDFAQVEVFDGSIWNVMANYTANVGYLLPSANTVVATSFDITAATGGSANAQIRFNHAYGWDWWWAIDNLRVKQPVTTDIGVVSIDTPIDDTTSCTPPLGSQTISLTLRNGGTTVLAAGTLVQIDFSLNGGPATTEFLVLGANLAAGATFSYTFSAAVNMPAPGPNTLAVTVILAGDLDGFNDTATVVYAGAGAGSFKTLPYIENFDAAPAQNSTITPSGWAQDLTDATGTDSNWYMHTGTTTTLNTGPQSDHTTGGAGYYAYVEDSGNFAQVNLLSPCFDLAIAVAPTCSFWMHSFNNQATPTNFQNFLSVDVLAYPGGAVTMNVFGPVGHQATAATWAASQWTQQQLDLTPFAGQIVRLRFRASSNGGSTNHDIAIDDVVVFDPQGTPGQKPRTGLAAFDINNGATNINGAAVSSGAGGPYFATVSQGGSFALSFDGHPNQPIAVIYGVLNPVSATYPGGIGQFDIGGPGVGPTGLPLNIAAFVNAIGWVQAGVPGFPIDALFFTGTAGLVTVNLTMPNFGIPSGFHLTTFQAAITAPATPFVYLSNAVDVTIN